MNMKRMQALWGGASLGWVIVVTIGVLVRDAMRERERISKMVSETVDALDNRTAEVRAKVDAMVASEQTGRYDPVLWDEQKPETVA